MENKPQKIEDMSTIMKNLSSLYSSISDGFIRLNQYISKYQLLIEKKEKNKTIDLTNDNDKNLLKEENKNNVVICLNNNNSSHDNTEIIEKDKNEKSIEEIKDKKKEENSKEEKIGKNKEGKNMEINTFIKKLNNNFKSSSKKTNKTEIKLPINNINNYYFKEINITNNNNIGRCITESKKKKEKNEKEKEESKENIINLDEEEDQNKKRNKKGNKKKGYKFKLKFLDYYYTFGYYQSYNDAYYDKVKISKYFNEIDLFNLNYNEQFSYKNISIKLKEKYPLLSVKYLKNNINFESKIKIK